jgi:membrane-associated protease RseP (regulator of RpoE activity)
MVLTIRRSMVCAALMLATTAHAQQGARGSGGSGGAFSGRGVRPVLFGFALECVDCQPTGRGRVGGGRGGVTEETTRTAWTYTQFPRVAGVLPNSLAESAGIRVGDVLTAIDGLSLLTEEGSRRFASAASGDEVRLTFERASKLIDVPLVLGRVATGRGQQMISVGQLSARYSGAYGNIDIDIWSDDLVNVSRDSTGAMLLRTGTTLIRVHADNPGDTLSSGRGARGSGARGRGRGGPPNH